MKGYIIQLKPSLWLGEKKNEQLRSNAKVFKGEKAYQDAILAARQWHDKHKQDYSPSLEEIQFTELAECPITPAGKVSCFQCQHAIPDSPESCAELRCFKRGGELVNTEKCCREFLLATSDFCDEWIKSWIRKSRVSFMKEMEEERLKDEARDD